MELLADVLRGGRDVADEAGAAVVGGHTITTEKEPIYGMVAIGFAPADALIRNDGLRPGMSLVLTKPLGIGILTTAIKRDAATAEQAAAVVATMTTLNAAAADAARAAGVRAGTDVTGFGLLGHLHRMAAASGVAATIDAGALPLLEGVLDLARSDVVPSGSKRNHAWLSPSVTWGDLTTPEQIDPGRRPDERRAPPGDRRSRAAPGRARWCGGRGPGRWGDRGADPGRGQVRRVARPVQAAAIAMSSCSSGGASSKPNRASTEPSSIVTHM